MSRVVWSRLTVELIGEIQVCTLSMLQFPHALDLRAAANRSPGYARTQS
jgi:hypothetical protein